MFLSGGDLAKIFMISRDKAYRMIRTGAIESEVIEGKRRVALDTVKDYIREHHISAL